MSTNEPLTNTQAKILTAMLRKGATDASKIQQVTGLSRTAIRKELTFLTRFLFSHSETAWYEALTANESAHQLTVEEKR